MGEKQRICNLRDKNSDLLNYSGLGRVVGIIRFPLEDNDPSYSFQEQSNASQSRNNSDISGLVSMLWVQDAKTFENIDDSKDKDRVSNSMVVNIPKESQFVVLPWPQQHRKHLKEKNTNIVEQQNKHIFFYWPRHSVFHTIESNERLAFGLPEAWP